MATLDPRGREVVDDKPIELSVGLGRPPRMTLAQQIQRALMLQHLEDTDQIRDDFDVAEDQADFGDPDSGPDDLIGPSPYEVGDAVPDFVSADDLRAQARQQQSSPSPSPSSSESPEKSNS